ncbi:MAG: hypothetical protein GC190_13010 [Alphaproteobacteria bacterium]|nr:hypothetical protein [Alphaproteobacteria bacterium]
MAHAPVNFWSNVRKRIIVVSQMDREVRLTFIAGVAVVTVAIALNLVDLVGGGTPIQTLVGRIPVLTLIFLSLGELVVGFLLFSGIARLRGWPRYAVLAGLAVALTLLLLLGDALLLGAGFYLPLVAVAIVAWLADRNDWTARSRTLATAALSLGSFLILVAYTLAGSGALVISAVGAQAMFAMFGLFMASTDFAELIELASEAAGSRLFEFLEHPAARLFAALVLAALNLVVSTYLVVGTSPTDLGAATGGGLFMALLCGLTLCLLLSASRHLGAVEPHVTYRQLLALVGIAFLAFQGGLLWRLLGDPATYDAKNSFKFVETGFVFLGVLVASLVAFLTVGRRSPHAFAPCAFGVVIGVFWFCDYLLQGENLASVGFMFAIGTFLLAGFGGLFRALRTNYGAMCALLAELNLCAILYTGLFWLFFPMSNEEEFGFWQAAFVLGALAWDIVSSGQVTTTPDSTRVPRYARVSLFFAYIISVALMVMLARSAQILDPITLTPTKFDSEALVAVGLALFGAPFFFFIFALRLRATIWQTPAPLNAASVAQESGMPR